MFRIKPAWLARQMRRKGLRYATELAPETGLSIPTAQALLRGDWQARIDAATVKAVMRYFGVTDPLRIIEWSDE